MIIFKTIDSFQTHKNNFHKQLLFVLTVGYQELKSLDKLMSTFVAILKF